MSEQLAVIKKLALLSLLTIPFVAGSQVPLAKTHHASPFHHFSEDIRRVAVIGAGASGLQAAAALIDQGFEVRLFERTPGSGGNWQYSDNEVPIPASYPDGSKLVNSSYHPDIPPHVPYSRLYRDGDDGLTTSFRLREQHSPSAAWSNMTTNSPTLIMTLPDVSFPAGHHWNPNNRVIQRLIRQYASAHALNANDAELSHVLSYSTRVERLERSPASGDHHRWTLTLRKMKRLGAPYEDQVRANWWSEEFDAVVVATGDWDAPWIPFIRGVKELYDAFPNSVLHAREYRRPTTFIGKNVLLIGAYASGIGIASDLVPFAKSVTISLHYPDLDNSKARFIRSMLSTNVSLVPEIVAFDVLPTLNGNISPEKHHLSRVELKLVNGTSVSGYDYIIFATGYRRSNPFLLDLHNSTIQGLAEPETRIAPIITDGTHVRSLHWTGHYIDDPTLGIMKALPWTIARYQALGFARVWAGKARLPSQERMWATYPGAGKELKALHGSEEHAARYFITWLNNEALEFGGAFVEHYPQYVFFSPYMIETMI
ncbi:FAD/NAD(P)-binding domain-containing protein [Clavulina sp. PMI_390]|nr:FAD/NAD(P)-binding domain-containing protein [Clavulina sp. PMI_390]